MVQFLNRMYYMYYCTCLRDVTPAAAFQEVDPPLQKKPFLRIRQSNCLLLCILESKTPKLTPVLCHEIPSQILYTTVQ